MPPVRRESARDDEIIRYLLGELPDDDAERLDEQSVVDDDFAARLRAAEDDLIDAYASGQLSGDRLKRFEAFYLASPHRRDRVAFARRFLPAIDDDARARQQRVPVPRRAGSELPASASWVRRWGLAAAAVIFLAFGALLISDARLRGSLREASQRATAADARVATLADQLAAARQATAAAEASLARAHATVSTSVVALVLLPQTRGVGTIPIIDVAPDATTVDLALAIEGAARGPYDAALKDPAGNQVVWRGGPFAAEEAQPAPLVSVALPAHLLKSQHYVVDLFAAGAGRGRDFAGSYAFEVVRR
jgi:anti-sigma factor RsiW